MTDSDAKANDSSETVVISLDAPVDDTEKKTSTTVHLDTPKKPSATDNDADVDAPADLPTLKREFRKDSPESTASFLTLVLGFWLDPLLKQGWKKPLEPEDLYPVLPHRKAHPLADAFEERWRDEKARHAAGEPGVRPPNVFRIVCGMHAGKLLPYGGLKILADAMISCTALMVQGLIRFLVQSANATEENPAPPYSWGFGYAMGILLLTCTSSVLQAYTLQVSVAYGVAVKGQLTAALYRKCLRLSGLGRSRFPAGTVLNLVSTDISRIELAFNQFNFVWTFPSWFLITVVLLLRIIGWPGLAGVAMMILFVPIQGLMIRRLMVLRKQSAGIADSRMKVGELPLTSKVSNAIGLDLQLISEILQGIRIIKYFAWEPHFLSKVAGYRDDELSKVRGAAYIRSVISSLGFAIPVISSAVTFLVYGAITPDNALDPSLIFAALALFNQLRQPVMWMPLMISSLGDAVVAFRRLQEVFDAPEAEFLPGVDPDLPVGVRVVDGEFVWEGVSEEDGEAKEETKVTELGGGAEEVGLVGAGPRPTLRNINLEAPRGRLTAIVGAVGSGKSSLVSAMIGEMKCNRGSVTFSGTVGYSTQQAWIVNASVKENILFGRPYDAAKYRRVVDACCLLPDFAVLPDGDQSEIGERGINLSGGQKQRVSLARLMYAEIEVAILDDPLSALDAGVGRTIFEKGILGLLKGRTVLLVTHHLHLLPRCDHIVLVRDGEIAEQGSFPELMAAKAEFSRMMIAHGGEHEDEDDAKPVPEAKKERKSAAAEKEAEHRGEKVSADTDDKDDKKPRHEQIKKEDKATGKIDASVLWAYIRNFGSVGFVVFTVVALVFTQVTRLSNDLWLVSWTQNAYTNLSRGQYMGIYAGLGVSQALALLLYSVLFAIGGIHAAKTLHENVLQRAVASPVGFFDQTPLGRIVNRLSRDVDYADNNIYDAMRLLFYSLLQLLAAFALVCYFTKGIFAVVLLPLLGVYYFVQLVYRASSREIKRIESVARSPLYAHIQESMNGLPTIRAFAEQDRFIQRTEELTDLNSSPLYLLYTGQRWIQLRLETIGNIFVFTVALYAAAARSSTNPSQIGLALSYLLQTTSLLNMAIFQAVEVEVQLNAIERLVEYTKLDSEEDPTTPKEKPPTEWPSKGALRLRNLSMRYQPDLPLVLRNVTLDIHAGEKIGVVGRTGSGKSSLMQALFRMVQLEAGSLVELDGIDCSKIALRDLRSRIAIIPQDPVLFSGSVRSNLDPNGRFGDDEIWRALERCGMKEAVAAMEGKLDASFVENGENISVGQRQLIAHRLNTIIDSDRILLLSRGEVVEFDTPRNLLFGPEGDADDGQTSQMSEFAKLVSETGDATVAYLKSRILPGSNAGDSASAGSTAI
ncbi:hypothetical protein HDU96_008952 [Phlyctochytrium bullatum]|nr:hypothetical protein HDU96_008952 [Phlyctochytrium bullatum]